jgi:hypothetical protein
MVIVVSVMVGGAGWVRPAVIDDAAADRRVSQLR